MKYLISTLIVVLLLGTSYRSEAAFPMKQPAQTTTAASQPASVAVSESAVISHASMEKRVLKKHKRVANTLPQVVYVLMAIFFLGWLAMGINDNFEGVDWLISLLLYVILYLPGLLFTLIKMTKYY